MIAAMIFGLGIALGFLIGIAADDALDLYRSSRKDRRAMRLDLELNPRKWFTRRRLLVAMGGFVVLTQFTVGVLLILTYTTTSRYTECSATWQEQFGRSYAARSEAATEVGVAIDRVVIAVDAGNRAEARNALDNYLDVRAEQDAARRRAPLPEPPDVLCGQPDAP